MKLVLTEEQQFLKDTAQQFARERTPVEHFRKLRDSNDQKKWSQEIWMDMVELGWSSILVPEKFGGSEFGVSGLCVVLQELGKTLTPSPLFATGVLGVSAINALGSDHQKNELFHGILDGSITTAFAIDEKPHHHPYAIRTSAKKTGDKYIISGKKIFVIDGASASHIIVIARTSNSEEELEGLSAFIIPSSTTNLKITSLSLADSRNYASIEFDDVEISNDMLLGDVGSASGVLENILDLGRIAIAAEMLGMTEEAFEITNNYLKERKQFGVLIGSFQALQHRAAKMFCEIELTKSAVLAAMFAADSNNNELARLASLAKFQVGETLHLVSNESIQMHGGIGVTDEYDIGLYLKRARVTEQIFGSADFHQSRYADISGF
ncbi:MAG: acyl-CoA dehydrogenase family protein [Gammaproteobacteria bacterium]